MYSYKDFEKLWFLYKTKGQPKGVSINLYCSRQDVSYKSFYDWLRKRQKLIVPVNIDSGEVKDIQPDGTEQVTSASCGELTISIQTEGGLQIHKTGLDYQGVKLLVEKLKRGYAEYIRIEEFLFSSHFSRYALQSPSYYGDYYKS